MKTSGTLKIDLGFGLCSLAKSTEIPSSGILQSLRKSHGDSDIHDDVGQLADLQE